MLKDFQKDQHYFSQKPRKLIKLNVREDENYNEFKGECQDPQETHHQHKKEQKQSEDMIKFKNFEEENVRNKTIYQLIKISERKIRSLKDASTDQKTTKLQKETQSINKTQIKSNNQTQESSNQKNTKNQQHQTTVVKLEQGQNPTISKPKVKGPKPTTNGMNNWANFVTSTQNKTDKPTIKSVKSQFVAMDCEFVKCGQEQALARISIVSDQGDCLFDSYIHPQKKITDYVTDISGITYTHIKNAPSQKDVIESAKKILYNKIIVGHTIWKDLQVCGLKEWKGYKSSIDICQFELYKQKNGKLISLKNLSTRFLGKKIQDGRHSSIEDAEATMSLFNLKKKLILKHFRVIS